MATPGTSRTLLEAVIPYSEAALCDWLGSTPESFCSARTARAMAAASFHRAVTLARSMDSIENPNHTIGVGCTASLASERPKRGPHRIHVGYQRLDRTWSLSLNLIKGARSRNVEDQLAGELVLYAMAHAADLAPSPPALRPDEKIEIETYDAPPEWSSLLAGQVEAARARGPKQNPSDQLRVLFPGSFNPLHPGHEKIVAIAAERTGLPVEFELAVFNADKPPLDFVEIANRIQLVPGEAPLWLTRCATFVEKSRLFPGTCFIVGADTITRIADPRFYTRRDHGPEAAFRQLTENGAHFIVFGRQMGNHFQTLADLDLPEDLMVLCEGIPEDEFREDISSTELRRQSNPDGPGS